MPRRHVVQAHDACVVDHRARAAHDLSGVNRLLKLGIVRVGYDNLYGAYVSRQNLNIKKRLGKYFGFSKSRISRDTSIAIFGRTLKPPLIDIVVTGVSCLRQIVLFVTITPSRHPGQQCANTLFLM